MSNRVIHCFLVFAMVSTLGVASAQTKSKTTKSSKTTAKAAETEKELTGRLPRFFSSLVDDKQRQEVYKVQADYRTKIESLEKQLAEMKAKEMAAMEKVLTTTQRKKLVSMRKAGTSKTASTSSKTTKATPASAKKPSSRSSSKSSSSKSTGKSTTKSSSKTSTAKAKK